ncbi:trypsin-like peptidase domain-containing protein [Streptomyces sp. HUAS MG47]|uniref:S1C family serine protease n=1 Tax=Streptomyces solicamelliae TaxID=3231716 RepID=UPI003877BB1D
MEDGKITGRKPKWWSRPASKPEPGAEPDPVIPGQEATAPTDPDGDFTLAAPTRPSTTGAPSDPETGPVTDGSTDADTSASAATTAEPATPQPTPLPAQPVDADRTDAPAADVAPQAPAAPAADAVPATAPAVPQPAPLPAQPADGPAAPAADVAPPPPAVADPVPAPAVGGEAGVPEPVAVPPQSVGDTAPVPAQPSAPVAGDAAPEGYRAPGQPLHQPDEYSTPPYGGPGPWAPAPPVQRPMAPQGAPVPPPAPAMPAPAMPAPAMPAPAPAMPAPAPAGAPMPVPAAMPAPAPAGVPMPVPAAMPAPNPHPVPAPASPWVQYDPWSVPGTGVAPPPGDGKAKRRGIGCAGVLALVLAAGVLGGAVGAYIERTGGLTTAVELPQADSEDIGRAPDSVAGIAASALPSVVTIHVKGGGSAGTGTGFVLDNSGHILTNNHVVDPAGSSGDISVTFSSGETAEATLVGKDSGYDLAVVKVKGVKNLKPLPLGNSDNVRVGDPVVAIGAPFDLQNTVTSGIISAKERPITAGGEKGDGSDISYVDALQTDAPINPGNSGGPLVDSKARVIGINSAIRAAGNGENPTSGQSGSIGLGFAIPINQGKRVAEELINTGKATHPVIGVSLDMQYDGDGARVGEKGKDNTPSVTPGGPAAKAGIRPGDVITKVDGQRVHNGEELIVKIRAHRPGDRLALTVLRGGSEQTKTLVLGSAQGS